MAKINMNRINENLIELDGKIRIERGPKLKIDIATEELLSDEVTAQHYKAPVVTEENGEKIITYTHDAIGETIELGKEIVYLDWLGEHTWYIYKQVEVTLEGGAISTSWAEVGTFDGDETEAVLHASSLL